MVNKPKIKGTAAESAFVKNERVLASFPAVERRALSGVNDMGDVSGAPGLVFEIKNHKAYHFAEWLKETEVEKANAQADFGILIVKPNRVGLEDVSKWWAVMYVGDMLDLLDQRTRPAND